MSLQHDCTDAHRCLRNLQSDTSELFVLSARVQSKLLPWEHHAPGLLSASLPGSHPKDVMILNCRYSNTPLLNNVFAGQGDAGGWQASPCGATFSVCCLQETGVVTAVEAEMCMRSREVHFPGDHFSMA